MSDAARPKAVKTGWVSRDDGPEWLREWLYKLPRINSVSTQDGYVVVDESDHGIGWMEPRPDPLPRPDYNDHRSGTCYDVESTEMRRAVVPGLTQLLDADIVLHEVRHQRNGYHTDLVLADINPEGLRQRAAQTVGTEPLHDPLQRFKTWWYIREHGPMHGGEAEQNGLYTDPAKNRKHIAWLLDHGWLARTATGTLVAYTPPRIADLHAVELKLRDWKTALEQADRANRFDGPDSLPVSWQDRYGYADYRWVAMDAGGIKPALENQQAFRDRGVGLLAVAEGGTVVKHVDAEHRPRERYTRDRAWAESEVWDRLDPAAFRDQTGDSGGRDADASVQPGLGAFTDGGDEVGSGGDS